MVRALSRLAVFAAVIPFVLMCVYSVLIILDSLILFTFHANKKSLPGFRKAFFNLVKLNLRSANLPSSPRMKSRPNEYRSLHLRQCG